MGTNSLSLRPPLILLAVWVLSFGWILLNGYALSFAGLVPNAPLVFLLVCAEWAALAVWLAHQPLRVKREPLELAGFLLVVVGVWWYFINPSLPTLLPPSYSGDAANHYAYISKTFSTGRIISDYPGGPAFIAVTLAEWIGWEPLRLLHLLGACWIALTAGGVYVLASGVLRPGNVSKVVALLAPFALFLTPDYFAGILIGAGYFWTQVASQFFIIAFVCFLAEYLRASHDAWLVGMAICLIGISVSFPLWLALPLALLGGAALRRRNTSEIKRWMAVVGGPLAVFWGVSILTGGRFIPHLSRFGGEGAAVIVPSLGALGGAYLLAPIAGLVLGARRSASAFLVAGLLVLSVLQTLTLLAAHLLVGVSSYWVSKSVFVWIYPMAVLAVIPLGAAVDGALHSRRVPNPMAALGFATTVVVLAAIVFYYFPPAFTAPLDESEIQVALWARAHLNTHDIHFISRRTLIAQWIGAGLWGESFPDDLWAGYPQLGPKTFEEWRNDPDWGAYLFVASAQHFPLDPGVRTVYQYGDSRLIEKVSDHPDVAVPPPMGQFGDALALIDYDLPSRTFRAGQVIAFTARLETRKVPAHQVVWRLQLRDLDHNSAVEARIDPFDNKFPLQRWPANKVVSQPFTLTLPTDVRAGLYDFELGLYYVGNGSPLEYRAVDGATDDVVSLGQIKVELPGATTHELGAATRLNLQLGDSISLLGYRLPTRSPIPPGGSLKVYLYWQSLAAPSQDFTVFVHLLDPAGILRAQSDSSPRRGTYPTSTWTPGEIVLELRTLQLPSDAPPGNYHLEVGMYQWPRLVRLPIVDASHRALGDHYVLPDLIRVLGK
jgi:hypothetical protein